MSQLLKDTLTHITQASENHVKAMTEKAQSLLKERARTADEKAKQKKTETREERQARFKAELQLKREEKMRPALRKEFARYAAELQKTQETLNPFIEALEDILIILNAPDSPFTVQRKDTGHAQQVLDFLKPREELIMRGTCDLSRSEHKALGEAYQAATGHKLPDFSKCFREDNVTKSLQRAIPTPCVQFDITTKPLKIDSPCKTIFTITLTGWNKGKKPSISYRGHNGYKGKECALTQRSFISAASDLCRSIMSSAPSYQGSFVNALQKLKSAEDFKSYEAETLARQMPFKFWR
jgi:hypothetical protein